MTDHGGGDPGREEPATLVDAILRAASTDRGIVFLTPSGGEEFVPYDHLLAQARLVLGHLQKHGVSSGAEIIIQFQELRSFVTAFWGCLLGAYLPVPLPAGTTDEYRHRLENVLRVLRDPWVLTSDTDAVPSTGAPPASGDPDPTPGPRLLLLPDHLEVEGRMAQPAPDDPAYLQFSSGSTGEPKGVILTHRNVLTNIGGLAHRTEISTEDRFLGWVPLTHDMGMIGFHLTPLVLRCDQALIPTPLFVRRPGLWMELASRLHSTYLGSPNFGLRHLLDSGRAAGARWDLSSVRVILNGAEPISSTLCRLFMAEMAPHGLREGVMCPGYGLAEASLVVTLNRPGGELRVVTLPRRSSGLGNQVDVDGGPETPDAVSFVDVGPPIPGVALRITDPHRRPLPERVVGNVEVKGENVTSGYYRNAGATSAVMEDGWLLTGDLGFVRDGQLVITGRSKDIIFVNGANYYPHDLERVAESVDGIELNRIAVCGVRDPASEEERVLAFVIHKRDLAEFVPRARAVQETVLRKAGVVVDECLPVRRIPKTSSGKIKRFQLAEGYLAGEFAGVREELRRLSDSAAAETKGALQGRPLEDHIAFVRRLAGRIVENPALDLSIPLTEQGFDSIRLTALYSGLGRAVDIEVPVSTVFDYPTVTALGGFLMRALDPHPVGATGGDGPARSRETPAEPVAIIGMACRFPGGCETPEAFWELLEGGVDAVGDTPADRWDPDEYFDPDGAVPGKMTTRKGAFLEGVDQFDPGFFGISAREAVSLDPQQRLLLEVAWEALEDASIDPAKLRGTHTGVFVGVANPDYLQKEARSGDVGRIDPYSFTGSAPSMASGRVSYVLGLNGPSLSVDTACSSSLVAVHLAVNSLRRGESEAALAGGVNIILSPDVSVGLSKMSALSPDGRCKTFDASADGYGRGEGCGMVVLKRLSDALRDGDRVLAVVHGTAINHDGASNGLTVPNGLAQQGVIRAALSDADLPPSRISYVEAHGTGTPLGDPVEILSLAQALEDGVEGPSPVLVGSVKTNIGHLESAAGVAGLMKVVLALQHRTIPPHLHVRDLNPRVPWEKLPVEVVREARPWTAGVRGRVAGISAFGFSGTNAHIIVGEAPEDTPREVVEDGVHLLPLSAPEAEPLRALALRYRVFLQDGPRAPTGDICYSAGAGRGHFRHRLGVVGSGIDLGRKLRAHLSGEVVDGLVSGVAHRDGKPPRVAFLFTGQGDEYPGMGRRAFDTQPVFRRTLHRCAEVLEKHLPTPLLDFLFPADGVASPIHDTRFTQPGLFALEAALVELWRSWGVRPQVVAGHGIGEYVAAWAAGVFSLEEGLGLVAERARLMAELRKPGGRVAVAAGEERVMEPILPAFAEAARRVSFGEPRLPIISNLSGAPAGPEIATPEYWVEHLRKPVRFDDGVAALGSLGVDALLEMGPAPVLLELARASLGGEDRSWLPSLRPGRDDREQLLESAAGLYVRGASLDWPALHEGTDPRRVPLPHYPFQRKRYWVEDQKAPAVGGGTPDPAALQGHTLRTQSDTPIAIIGLGCRFPGGADSPESFWELLRKGTDATCEIPRDRWDADAYYDPDPRKPGTMITRRGGFLKEIDRFDPELFRIPGREAVSMDPQHRLLLEVAWEALERAGRAGPHPDRERTGVFLGISTHEYGTLLMRRQGERPLDAYFASGNSLNAAAGRLAYILGLNGPCMAVDTACSSSLVAVHLACDSLRSGAADMALAAGVSIMLLPEYFVALSRAQMLAPDGRCKPFDAAADGYGRGEGCGVAVLKRLEDALRDGDRVLAVVRGSGINQDGASAGFTAPNGLAQERLIRQVLETSGVAPVEVGYVEAHGTGTVLGDPVELGALGSVFGPGRKAADALLVGSVKSNIGHLECASGLAGLVKVVLSLQHGEIPPSINFSRPNPRVDWDALGIRVPVAPTRWEPRGGRRIAGLSGFGASGTNAHILLEEPPIRVGAAEKAEGAVVLPISATSDTALRELAGRYRDRLDGVNGSTTPHDPGVKDIAFTAGAGRGHFHHRLAVVGDSPGALSSRLATYLDHGEGPGISKAVLPSHGEPPRIAFLFTGQGAQYPGMGRRLFERERVFRETMERCDEILRPLLPQPLLSVLYAVGDADADGLIHRTDFTQPALFALEASLAELWRSWGIEPQVVLGHSVGGLVAAWKAGVFDLEDGLRLIAERGRLMQERCEGGRMAAVFAGEDRVLDAISSVGGCVSLAAVNGPGSCVVSGRSEEVEGVVARLRGDGVKARFLTVSHAFHSPLMEPVEEPFSRFAGRIGLHPPRLTLISDVTGNPAGSRIHTPAYWVDQLRKPVRFREGMETLAASGVQVVVEIGPRQTLLAMGRQCDVNGIQAWLPSLRPDREDREQMLESLAGLYVRGAPVHWLGVHGGTEPRRTELPTYPFQRKRFWVDGADAAPPPLSPPADMSDLLYRIAWIESPLEGPAHLQDTRWLILADSGGTGAGLAGLIRSGGGTARVVEGGDRSLDVDGLEALLGEGPVDGIVHLGALDMPAPLGLDTPTLMAAQGAVCGEVVNLVKVMARVGEAAPPLWLVTRGATRVEESPVPGVCQSTLWGIGKVVALEHPELWGGLVDLPPVPEEAEAEHLLASLTSGSGEDQVSLRNGRKFVARLRRTTLGPVGEPEIGGDGLYLVTGGAGALGLRTAGWLVDHGARHLILLGRRGLTPEGQPVVQEMVERGVSVEVLQADIANVDDLEGIRAGITAAGKPLRGIIHAAGVTGIREIEALDPAEFMEVLAPKVAGTWNLHLLASGAPLDFFVCFSSIASVWGSKGQAAYAAANHFLDAFAHFRETLGLPALSINWGPLAQGGMATEEIQESLRSMGVRPLFPESTLAQLGGLLSVTPQVTVADIGWKTFRALFESRGRRPFLEEMDGPGQGDPAPATLEIPILRRSLQEAHPGEREERLVAALLGTVALLLEEDAAKEMDPEASFHTLGLDSFLTVELRHRLERELGLKLPATLTYEYPSVMKLADHLIRELFPSSPEPPERGDVEDDDGPGDEEAVRAMSQEGLEAFIEEQMAHLRKEEDR